MNNKTRLSVRKSIRMNTMTFSGYTIFRPRPSTERGIRQKLEGHLRSKYSAQVYCDKTTINAILQGQYSFLSTFLVESIRKIAGRSALEFLLHQYNISCEIDIHAKSGRLNVKEENEWSKHGPVFRRAIKHMAELMQIHFSGTEARMDEQKTLDALDTAFSAAEQMVELYILSDQTHSLFPDRTILEILPAGQGEYFRLEVVDSPNKRMRERIRVDSNNRSRFIPETTGYIYKTDAQAQYLNAAFLEDLGISYTDCMRAIWELINNASLPKNEFQVMFCNAQDVLRNLARASGIDESRLKHALDAFSIRKEEMEAEGRTLYKPKQEHRAYRRAFYEFPWKTGVHYCWSPNMAKESFITLVSGIPFKQLPTEWKTPGVLKAIEQLSGAVSTWFEVLAAKQFTKLGFTGKHSLKSTIGKGSAKVYIPSDVGEIDFIGYSSRDNILFISEMKMVNHGFEPALFRDDISEFVTSKNSYIDKFRRKIQWVIQNFDAVFAALKSEVQGLNASPPIGLAVAIVTGYPSFASFFISDVPCVSLTELMVAYEHSGKWPYELFSTNSNGPMNK